MTTRWTFRDPLGRFPATDFGPEHRPSRTTGQVDRARLWVTAQAARRAATLAGIDSFTVVAVRGGTAVITHLSIASASLEAEGPDPERTSDATVWRRLTRPRLT